MTRELDQENSRQGARLGFDRRQSTGLASTTSGKSTIHERLARVDFRYIVAIIQTGGLPERLGALRSGAVDGR